MRMRFTQLVKPFGENPFFRGWSSPSGTTPQSAGADSSPFRGAMGVAGYNIRCRKPMPPLKGEGDREVVERCAPGANVSPFHNLPTHSKTPRDESLGALCSVDNLT